MTPAAATFHLVYMQFVVVDTSRRVARGTLSDHSRPRTGAARYGGISVAGSDNCVSPGLRYGVLAPGRRCRRGAPQVENIRGRAVLYYG